MNGKTTGYTQISRLLEAVQEFINTNPNEITTLADSALLMEAMHAELNSKDAEELN